jgi:hypothetical protein
MPAVGSITEVDGKPLARPLRIGKYMMSDIGVSALREAADFSGRDSIFCNRAVDGWLGKLEFGTPCNKIICLLLCPSPPKRAHRPSPLWPYGYLVEGTMMPIFFS